MLLAKQLENFNGYGMNEKVRVLLRSPSANKEALCWAYFNHRSLIFVRDATVGNRLDDDVNRNGSYCHKIMANQP